MMTINEWERWQTSWLDAPAAPAELENMLARTRRARRGMIAMRTLSFAMAVVSLAAVGLAMRHAANAYEAALGLFVGVGIAAAWLIDATNRDRANEGVEAPPMEYTQLRRALCARQRRFARLGWIVAVLELLFLVPWWIGGIAVHGLGVSPARVLNFWGPLAAIIGFIAWSVRLHWQAGEELDALVRDEDGG